ncbi:DUF3566 domain-containing protein [Nocardioides sp.]|uniref:DUF3566 domain-containing protein n=1 Tax=Nocardioides sp. TaxID=35761 RepID=UPI00260E3026|nr:DUF3566 domain-containing protein [Nocardioides sp.]
MADDDTAVRTGLAQQLKGRLQAAAEEFKTTAVGETGPVKASGKSPRRARLALSRIDPWSVMKAGFLLSAALAIVTVVAVFIVWTVLGAAGVWDSINTSVQDVVGGQDASTFNIRDYLGTGRVMGFTVLVSVINIVLMTAVATLGAFLYNMAAALVGGIDLTLTEER